MKFWNWGPTTIWHNTESVALCFSKSLHPTVQYILLSPCCCHCSHWYKICHLFSVGQSQKTKIRCFQNVRNNKQLCYVNKISRSINKLLTPHCPRFHWHKFILWLHRTKPSVAEKFEFKKKKKYFFVYF